MRRNILGGSRHSGRGREKKGVKQTERNSYFSSGRRQGRIRKKKAGGEMEFRNPHYLLSHKKRGSDQKKREKQKKRPI